MVAGKRSWIRSFAYRGKWKRDARRWCCKGSCVEFKQGPSCIKCLQCFYNSFALRWNLAAPAMKMLLARVFWQHFNISVELTVTSCAVQVVLRVEDFPFHIEVLIIIFVRINQAWKWDTRIWYGKCILLSPILKEHSLLLFILVSCYCP